MTLPTLTAHVRLHRDDTKRPTKLLAFAELTIGGAFVIKGIRILARNEAGHDEPFVVFPAEKAVGGDMDRWFDVAHPTTAEARALAVALVLQAYDKMLAERP